MSLHSNWFISFSLKKHSIKNSHIARISLFVNRLGNGNQQGNGKNKEMVINREMKINREMEINREMKMNRKIYMKFGKIMSNFFRKSTTNNSTKKMVISNKNISLMEGKRKAVVGRAGVESVVQEVKIVGQ